MLIIVLHKEQLNKILKTEKIQKRFDQMSIYIFCYLRKDDLYWKMSIKLGRSETSYMSNTNANVQWTYEMSIGHMTDCPLDPMDNSNVHWTCACPLDISNVHWIFECQLDPMD
jgi:hypothetical protein